LLDRVTRASAIYRKLIAGDDPVERAWAWNGLGTIEFNFYGNDREAVADYLKAIASTPDFTIGYFALAARYLSLDDKERELAAYRRAGELLHRTSVPDLNQDYLINARTYADVILAGLTAEFAKGIPIAETGAQLPNTYSVLGRGNFVANVMLFMVRRHEPSAAKAYLHSLDASRVGNGVYRAQYYSLVRDWSAIAADEAAQKSRIARAHGDFNVGIYVSEYNDARPYYALAKAGLGDLAGAEATIAPAAADCDACLRTRAQLAIMRGQNARADYWFARAVANAPSIPFAYADWGQALLDRGNADGAIAKFTLANLKGPHFADPIEMWGEALMAKNRSDRALAKFAEAEKYAPNWGRLHLKWGEALGYAGKKDEAQKQFARAAQLDLSDADKAELAKQMQGKV
jgi:tetratricopeptide (TPR) repeat protein